MRNRNRILALLDEIESLSGLKIFTKTRKRDYVEIRSLLYVVLRKYYRFSYREIIELCSANGYYITHASIIHAVKSFDIYMNYNKNLQDWYHAICIDLDEDVAAARIDFIKPKLKYLSEDDLLKLSTIVKEMYEEAIIKIAEQQQNEVDKVDIY